MAELPVAKGGTAAESTINSVRAAPDGRLASGVWPPSRPRETRVEVSITVSPGDGGTDEKLGEGRGQRGVRGRRAEGTV